MNTVVLLSGGMDSATLLYAIRAEGHEVLPYSVRYGQRHAKELVYAERLCARLHLSWQCIDMSVLRPILAGSSQTSDEIAVPEGHYAEESMKRTVVPNRNMILLATATAYAISQQADAVAYAAHAGDHSIYPDCRPVFTEAMAQAMALCDWHPVRLLTPFIDKTKTDICRLGTDLGVPWEHTWSCYKGLDKHCGRCGTCYERREAFTCAGILDPTDYAV